LARVYRSLKINETEAAQLESDANAILAQYKSYAAECVQNSGNNMMILNDLQPTFLGRFTGLKLLKYLRANMGTHHDGGA